MGLGMVRVGRVVWWYGFGNGKGGEGERGRGGEWCGYGFGNGKGGGVGLRNCKGEGWCEVWVSEW